MLSSQLNNEMALDLAPLERGPSAESLTPGKRRTSTESIQPVLSPSPRFREPIKRSQDDISCEPTTPRRPSLPARGLSLQMPSRDVSTTASLPGDSVPLLPPSHDLSVGSILYGTTPGSIPRRSRGLDFSRAATNLHHSTVAEQSSPDCSPTLTGRSLNIPGRRGTQFPLFGDPPSVNNTWSIGSGDKGMSGSLGSINMVVSDSSDDSSGDDDIMDADDIDESILTTPQVRHAGLLGTVQNSPGTWPGSANHAVSSLMNFQQRHKMRSGQNRKAASNLSTSSLHATASRSPPTSRTTQTAGGYLNRELLGTASRRDSMSWAANVNQLQISSGDDEKSRGASETEENVPLTPGRPGVIRRAVTRRGNMLPKTKGFARIRAALAEESAPVETEVRREADVIRQVRESEPDSEVVFPHSRNAIPNAPGSLPTTAQSSPMFGPSVFEALNDIPEDDMMLGPRSTTPGSEHASFRSQAARNERGGKGRVFWDGMEESHRTSPMPHFARGSTSGASENGDIRMDGSTPPSNFLGSAWGHPPLTSIESMDTTMPVTSFTPVHRRTSSNSTTVSTIALGLGFRGSLNMPSSAEITRKVNNKRRRDDDFDDGSFKRRAVSPGMAGSVAGSPVLQSPLQRDVSPWGTAGLGGLATRPGTSAGCVTGSGSANGGGVNAAGTSAWIGKGERESSEGTSSGGTPNLSHGGGSAFPGMHIAGTPGRSVGGSKRVGLQGMVDTKDGLMNMSIE